MRILLVTLVFLAACSQPDPVADAIAEYEQRIDGGHIDMNLKVLEWAEIGTFTAGDSARLLRPLLEGKEAAGVRAFGEEKNPVAFKAGFKGTAMEPHFLRLQTYEEHPDSVIARFIRAKWRAEVAGVETEQERVYAVGGQWVERVE